MKYLLCLLILLPSYYSHSQDFNKWSVDGNLGLNSALGPFTEGYQSNFLGIYHADANIRYQLSNKFGVMWGLGFDRIKHDEMGHYSDSEYFKVHYFRTSLQAVFNVGRMADFHLINERVGLLLHGGFGFSSLKNAHYSVWFQDWKTQGTDEMMHLMIGFTPQVKLKKYLAIHMDFTFVGNIWQTKTFDFTQPNEFHKGIDGKIATFSIGASYYFGKGGSEAEHLDWVFSAPENTDPMYSPGDTIIERETIRTIEKIRIVGGDKNGEKDENVNSTPDPHSPDGDIDGDGILNKDDSCPTTPGDDPNGCPSSDRDGDGVANRIDDCPDVPGEATSGGCPPIDISVEKILNEAMREVEFEEQNADIIETSFVYLDKIVKVLNDHPEYLMDIEGHTDNSGEPGPNLSLSKARAEKIKKYIVDKGITEDRVEAIGYGEKRPIASNDSPSGRQQNERIEFKIRFQ